MTIQHHGGRNAPYDCDCCGAPTPREQVACVWAYGIETYACPTCRNVEPEEDDNVDRT